jgi:hypothetical protein
MTRHGDASINQGRNVQTRAADDVGRPMLPSVLRWFKGVRGSDAMRCTSCKPPQRGSCGLGLSMRPCAPCVPRNITTMIRMHTMHRGSAATRAVSRPAQPSQREAQLDHDADYQTAYHSHSRGQRRTRVTTRQPQARSTTQADCRWHGSGPPRVGVAPSITDLCSSCLATCLGRFHLGE